MSGDVQPRKRSDKKRRKDDGDQIPIQTHTPSLSSFSTSSASDDVNIHLHKEGGTGGGICAKLIFFILSAALIVLIGICITEYRGLTDVDIVDTESKFSQIFESWIDSSLDHHDEHDIKVGLDAHDLEDHDAEDNLENISKEEYEDEEPEPSEEDEEEAEDYDYDKTVLSEETYYEYEAADENDDETQEDIEDKQNKEILGESEELDGSDENNNIPASDEDSQEEVYESIIKKGIENKEDVDDQHSEHKAKFGKINSEEDIYDSGDDDDDDEDNDMEDSNEHSEQLNDEEDQIQDVTDTVNTDRGEGEKRKLQLPQNVVVSSKVSSVNDDLESPAQEYQESSGMAVKLGVGVALLVVAHLVLVRKWRTAPADKPSRDEPAEPVPDLSRRNTIVVPPTFREVEPDIEQEEEDYSDEELNDEDDRPKPKSTKAKYQELRSTYSRSLTPETELDDQRYSHYQEYEENIDKEEAEEASEEEGEEGAEDGDEYSENEDDEEDEDEELLKRLEAKYGILNKENQRGANLRSKVNEDPDSDKHSDDDTGGYRYTNITNKDDHKIKDEIDDAQKTVKYE